MSLSKRNNKSDNPYLEDSTLLDMEKIIQFLGEEAQLPMEGLPKRWSATQIKHRETPLDPKTVEEIAFIDDTYGSGHAATISRLKEMKDSGLLSENAIGDILAPCFTSGDYVPVKSLEADHAQPKEDIFKRQLAVIARLNEDKSFAQRLLQQPYAGSFFIEDPPKSGNYKGSKFFYEIYYNDINNIWLLCHYCNNSKNNEEFYSWLEKQWLYGKSFLDYIRNEGTHNNTVLQKVGDDKKGLGEIAIKWFATSQSNYLKNLKALQEKIINPIQHQNQQGARAIAQGKRNKGNKYLSNANTQIQMVSGVTESLKTLMPEHNSDTSSLSPSDEEATTQAAKELNLILKSTTEDNFSLSYTELNSKRKRKENNINEQINQTDNNNSSNSNFNLSSTVNSKASLTSQIMVNNHTRMINEIKLGNNKGFTPINNPQELIGTSLSADEKKHFDEYVAISNTYILDILGIDKFKAVKILSHLSENEDDREFLSSSIKLAIEEGKLNSPPYKNAMSEYNGVVNAINETLLKNGVITNKFQNINELQDFLSQNDKSKIYKDILDVAYNQKNNAINQITLSPETFKSYISLIMSEKAELNIYTALLLAREESCNMVIWRNLNNSIYELTPHYNNYNPNNQITYNIRQLGNSGNFSFLIEKDIPSLSIQASNISPSIIASSQNSSNSKTKSEKIHKREDESNNNTTQSNNSHSSNYSSSKSSNKKPFTQADYNTARTIYGAQPSLADMVIRNPSSLQHQTVLNTNDPSTLTLFPSQNASRTQDDSKMNENDDNNNSTYSPPRPGSSNNGQ
jgi:hypothetical protein